MNGNGKSIALQVAEIAGLVAPRYNTWRIWYMLPATDLRLARQRRGDTGDDRPPLLVRQSELQNTHRCVAVMPVPAHAEHKATADNLYHYFQAETWSPSGEARPLIAGLGLQHTSMSIGDVIENFDAKCAWMVADIGFIEIPQ